MALSWTAASVLAGLRSSRQASRRALDECRAHCDEIVTDAGLRYGAGDLAEPLKLTAGKKRHALVVIG